MPRPENVQVIDIPSHEIDKTDNRYQVGRIDDYPTDDYLDMAKQVRDQYPLVHKSTPMEISPDLHVDDTTEQDLENVSRLPKHGGLVQWPTNVGHLTEADGQVFWKHFQRRY